MKRILLSISAIMFVGTSMAQWWTYNSLINGGGNVFGTSSSYNAPINIFTNGIFRAQFTTGNALNSYSGNSGDGLRIRNTGLFPSGGNLDLFTSNAPGQNETHAVFGLNGQVSGQNNRFEVMATNSQGLYLNTLTGPGWIKFARFNKVQGFLGTNDYWRIGEQQQNQNLNAERRLHVIDNTTQFRLSFSGPNSNGGSYTDFLSNSNGNLQIMPTGGRVGINLNSNPTANLDVNGNVRIRNVQAASPNSILVGVNANGASDVNVRRLDFNGNANTFLAGNGTFQTINTTPPPANNGVSRFTFFGLNPNAPYKLGDVYDNSIFNTNTPLTNNRQVRLNGKAFVFSGSGSVGVGLNYPDMPTEVLDVNGNGRFRNVPAQGGQSLILGLQNGTNANDVELSRLALPNDNTQVLLGDGTWGAVPVNPSNNISAQNGLNLIHPDTVELGGPLLHNTEVSLEGYDMVFNNTYGNFQVGINNGGVPLTSTHGNIILGSSNTINFTPSVYPQGWSHHIFGNSNSVFNYGTNIFGRMNTVGNATNSSSGIDDYVIGINNKSNTNSVANNSYTMGAGNETQGYYNYIFGKANKIDGEESFAYGNDNIVKGFRAHAFGTKVYAPEYIVSLGNSVAMYNSAANIESYLQAGGSIYTLHNDPNFTTASQDIPAINISNGNNVAIKKYYATAALDVWGTILQNGNNVNSDATLKHNIQNYHVNADSLIQLLQPRTFEWNSPQDTFMLGTQYGFVAQEFEQVIPEFVRAGKDSIKHINTSALFPLFVTGYKQQSQKIDDLTSQNDSLKQQVNNQDSIITDLNNRLTQLENCLSGILPYLCQLSQSAVQANTPQAQEEVRQSLQVTLSNRTAIVLDQNVPNPFAEQTTIRFSIPESVKKAQLHFYDAQGKFLQSVEVTERGMGSLTVFGSDLSSGIYTYTLVADGVVVATKKMMKE